MAQQNNADGSTGANKTYNTADMNDAVFWQKVALEAVHNEDPAKALALRIEEWFETAAARPRQDDTLLVEGIERKTLYRFLYRKEFSHDLVVDAGHGKYVVEGIEYTAHEEYQG